MKFVAVQTGARRGYAVPLILQNAGMLDRFYTDLAGNVGVGQILSVLRFLPGVSAGFERLANRQIPDAIISQTSSFPASALYQLGGDLIGDKSTESQFRRRVAFRERWGRAMTRVGFGGATHIYSMLGEGHSFLAEAKRRGLTVVTEVYILLGTEKLLESERAAFPEWEPAALNYTELRQQFAEGDILMDSCHYYVCPSVAVQDDLIVNRKIPFERTALVPYGMHPRWLELEQNPQPGRVLFVGTAELRKGIHYLAMAAEKLRERGRCYEIRIAGDVSDAVLRQPICRYLQFLGRVPRDRIHKEFQQADVFVLPSLAEGSAEVTYEALAAGVPLVVTKAAGSVARDGVEGLIVPERDPVALADAIERVVEHRELRQRMAFRARETARDFTWEKYGERLVGVLKGWAA